MDTKAFMKLSDGKLNQYLKSNGFQEKYRAQNVKQLVEAGTVKPADLATYLEDANALLFNTPVTGAEVYPQQQWWAAVGPNKTSSLLKACFTAMVTILHKYRCLRRIRTI